MLRQMEGGQLRCSEVSADDFELVGEYAMGRLFATPQQHEAMNQMMVRMMGAVGAMGMMGGSSYTGPGSMMGGFDAGGEGDQFDGPSAAAMIAMMAILIGAVAGALLWFGRRGHNSPLKTLEQRFARGDLSPEDYEERRKLLGGGGR